MTGVWDCGRSAFKHPCVCEPHQKTLISMPEGKLEMRKYNIVTSILTINKYMFWKLWHNDVNHYWLVCSCQHICWHLYASKSTMRSKFVTDPVPSMLSPANFIYYFFFYVYEFTIFYESIVQYLDMSIFVPKQPMSKVWNSVHCQDAL